MTTNTLCRLIWGSSKVGGTPAIAAPGPSYAVAFSELSNKSASGRPSADQAALLVRSMKIEKRMSQELRR
jgi:hypothetical protein